MDPSIVGGDPGALWDKTDALWEVDWSVNCPHDHDFVGP